MNYRDWLEKLIAEQKELIKIAQAGNLKVDRTGLGYVRNEVLFRKLLMASLIEAADYPEHKALYRG